VKLHYGLKLVTPPAKEPVSDKEALLHLRIEQDQLADLDLIHALIVAARQWWENASRFSLITQTWDITFDAFPFDSFCPLLIPKNPVQAITSIQYVDTSGVLRTWDSSEYIVDTASLVARITPAYGKVWPYPQTRMGSVIVRTRVGYGDSGAAVPAPMIAGIKLLLGAWYENREQVVFGKGEAPYEVPFAVDALLNSNRIMEFS
jgi:uncharacterized phiE125 gp8 family phage protein